MRVRIAVLIGATLALALSAAAQAALPKTSNKLIVPNKSIGGVALGDKVSAVTGAWGNTPNCQLSCLYDGHNTADGGANVILEKKSSGAPAKVVRISLTAGEKTVGSKSVPNFKTPLAHFKTAKGIGLGSKASALKHAYHAAKKEGSSAYTIKGPKQISTVFGIGTSGKITSIGIQSVPSG